jgi:hypothetical protein
MTSAILMTSIGKLLIVLGLALAAVGALFLVGEKLGLGKLPGDLTWRSDKVTVHFPLVSSVVVSLVLTLLLNWWFGRR